MRDCREVHLYCAIYIYGVGVLYDVFAPVVKRAPKI